jgi:hypothetical protein
MVQNSVNSQASRRAKLFEFEHIVKYLELCIVQVNPIQKKSIRFNITAAAANT